MSKLQSAFVMMGFAAVFVPVATFGDEEPGLPETVAPGAKLVEIYGDDRFFEGPTWDPVGQRLYFTAFGDDNQQILRLVEPGKVVVWKDRTEGVNGTFLANDGRLLGAQAYGHRLLSYSLDDDDAEAEVLVHDPRLNQPNDVCQAPNGDIYYTDPDFPNQATSAVYRRTPDGEITKVLDDMPIPNGVLCSNDGTTLYVSDSGDKHWRAYPIEADGNVGPGRVFFDPDTENDDSPDGMTIDEQGNLYFTGRGGVWVVNSEGEALGLIPVPEFCSNVTFGGPGRKTLYLTCSKKVYQLDMTVRGGRAAGAIDVQGIIEEGYLDSSGVQLHYAKLGEGPLVVMIHGFPDFWYTWRAQMPALARHFQVVALDQRGYNKSDQPEGAEAYDLDRLVEDVAAVLRHFERDSATIVGHDWGGLVAWTFAMRFPERTERLVILNLPHPRGLIRELANNPAQQKASQYARDFQQPEAADLVPVEALVSWVRDPIDREIYLDALSRSSMEGMLNYYKANYPQPPYEEIPKQDFPEVSCPVLMIHGLQDTALLPGALNDTWNWINAPLTLITLPDAGHFVQQDAPETVTSAMVWWLTQPPFATGQP